MDDFQTRMIRNLKKRHEDQLRQNAERIQEHIGYVLQRLDNGQSTSVGHYARGIEADAHEIRARVSALTAIEEALGILDTDGSDSPS